MVPQRLESQDDLSPLNDANFVTQVLSSMPVASSSANGKPWPGLGVRRDVLMLEQSKMSDTQQGSSLEQSEANRSSILPFIPPTTPLVDDERDSPTHHQLTTSELQAQTKTSIMDRPRGVRRGGDPAGDGTAGGFNYGYDNTGRYIRAVLPCLKGLAYALICLP